MRGGRNRGACIGVFGAEGDRVQTCQARSGRMIVGL